MSIAFIVITALVIIVSVLLVALILAQKKENSIEGKLEFLTKIAVVVYFVLVLVSNFVK